MTSLEVTEPHETGSEAAGAVPAVCDTVVVGAGFTGLYMLHRLRELGLSAVAFEKAPDVGGTWYWNAYPGARCDAESLLYSYSFDPELKQEYTSKWPERYSAQPAIHDYIRDVADRYDLRRDIRFKSRVTKAAWNEAKGHWAVETAQGHRVSCRFLVSAVGCLSESQVPDIPGLNSFQGEWYHTGRWPHREVDFTGRRVVQIGTGSSGVQAAPVIAETAAHLTVLQRTPQYTIPAHNVELTPEFIEASFTRFGELAERLSDPSVERRRLWRMLGTKNTFDDIPEEREAYFERLWQLGGPAFPFAYLDTMTDPAANDEAAKFVQRKIREIVRDPVTAEKLIPSYPIGAKRQISDTGYYAMYNRPNVTLEDIRADPIERITPEGIRLRRGKLVEADIIVFATGFDAMTGPLFGLGIEGTGGTRLRDAWEAGPQTYLGIASHGFPNLFFLTGPGSPSVLSNVIASAEQHVDWLVRLLTYLREHDVQRIEADADAQERWGRHITDMASESLYPQADSWYLGANIPGKPRVFMPYIGGNAYYQTEIDEVAAKGYDGFQLE